MDIPFINDFLKRERKKRGITQEKFADMIFKSLPTVGRYDTGSEIQEKTLKRACEVLGIDFLILLKGQEEESLEGFESWEEIDKHNDQEMELLGYSTPQFIDPPYEKLLRKYRKELETITFPNQSKNNTLTVLKSDYDINILKSELDNYLELKNNILNIPTEKRENEQKIEKILSFIDFLYFDDIIKK